MCGEVSEIGRLLSRLGCQFCILLMLLILQILFGGIGKQRNIPTQRSEMGMVASTRTIIVMTCQIPWVESALSNTGRRR